MHSVQTQSALVQEMHEYCAAHKLRLNMLAGGVIESVAGAPFTSTPFGALQRITNLKDFKLEGGDREGVDVPDRRPGLVAR